MKRGDVVVTIAPGDYGKPRPAVVVQSDLFVERHASLVVCPFTTRLEEAPLFRLTVDPTPGNGLERRSQIMVDKIIALRRDRVRAAVGRLSEDAMIRLNRSLALFLGLVG